LELVHGCTSQPQTWSENGVKAEKRVPLRACAFGMVSFFIDEKSAG
jgi:hypothetical protein